MLDPPTGPELFLGCIHERITKVINGVTARGFAYNMESYLLDTVKRYCEMVKELTGKQVNLSKKRKSRRRSYQRILKRHQVEDQLAKRNVHCALTAWLRFRSGQTERCPYQA